VRGIVAGRTLLYPTDGSVEDVVAMAAEMVHIPSAQTSDESA